MSDEPHFTVTLRTIGIESRDEAEAFAVSLNDAFCAMPDAQHLGCTVSWAEDAADRITALEAQLANANERARTAAILVSERDARLAKARADRDAAVAAALEKAAGVFHEEQVQNWSQEILEGLAMADLFTPSTYDDKIDAHRIVQGELTDIADAIRALIPTTAADALAEVRREARAVKPLVFRAEKGKALAAQSSVGLYVIYKCEGRLAGKFNPCLNGAKVSTSDAYGVCASVSEAIELCNADHDARIHSALKGDG